MAVQSASEPEQTRAGYKIPALRILSEIATGLSTESDLEALLERFLGTMIRLAGADAGAVRVLTEDGAHMRLVGALGLPAEVLEHERYIELECGICGEAARDHACRDSTDLKRCSDRTSLGYFGSNCRRIVAVPLRYQGKTLGVYNLFLSTDTPVPEEVSLLFHSIGEHLGMALENARLTRENLRATLTTERQMLANELHDSLAQTMAYMKMRLSLLREALEQEDKLRADKYLNDVSQALGSAYAGLRDLLTHFRNRMDPRGLLPALQEIADGFPDRTGIALRFSNRVPDLNLTPDQEIQAFHIVQEALANIGKHSRARHVELEIGVAGPDYLITIADDGIGIPPESGNAGAHFGLSIMRERAQLLGGTVAIENRPEGGTRIRLAFPRAARK